MIPQVRSLLLLALLALLFVSGLLVGLDRLGSTIQAQASTIVPFGQEMTSSVQTRAGEQWHFTGCISDVVTIVMTSTAFSPYIELIGPQSAESVATGEADGDSATIADHPLAASGSYTLWVGGDSRSARGDYRVAVHLAGSAALADVAGMAAYNVPVTGAVTTRAGQSWSLHACAGDVITIAMESDAFDPYLELLDPATEESLAEDDNSGAAQSAQITSYTFAQSGLYQLTALGTKRSDRGAYTLLITTQHGAKPAVSAATATPTRRATAPLATPTPAQLCTVKVEGLNLRSGPGTVYQPPIGNLAAGTQLRPLARDRTSSWLEVQAPGNKTGWISAGAQYVTCAMNIATLPVGVIPPPPTATATPLPTPTQQIAQAPTPTPPSFFGLPGGSPGGDFDGDIVSERGMVNDRNNPVFRDRFYLRMEVYDTPRNARVERVEFRVTDDNGDEVYSHTERTAGYCIFGGGEPNCNVLFLQPGVTWPDTDRRIADGFYNVDATVFLEGDNDSGNWNSSFEIDIPGQDAGDNQDGDGQNENGQNGGNNQLPLEIYLAQTGPGTTDGAIFGELAFQVIAYDPNVGTNDGDGIANVDLRIFGPGGEIHQRTENNPGYCAFGGGEPDCTVVSTGEVGMESGVTYILQATASADDGRQLTQEWQVTVQ